MAQVINTNISSLNAQRNLTTSQTTLATSLQRLSSGLRINSAKDDAAGLAISERMTTQIRGVNQAIRNANDGISLAQTGEGALAELTQSLQRIRELAVQSANATNSASDRQALNLEVQQRLSEIDRVSSQTSFNGRKILDGSFGTAAFQIGSEVGQTISLNLDGSTRLNSIGKIASATSGALGSASTGGYLSLAGITPGDFSQTDATAASGKVSFAPATLNFGTPTAGITYGSYEVTGVTNADMSAGALPASSAVLTVSNITGADFSATPTSLDFTNISLNQTFSAANHLDFTIQGVSGASYNIKLETDLSVPANLATELNTQLSAANADVRAVVTANGGNVDVSFVNWDDALNQAITGPTVGTISVTAEAAYGTATTALAGGVQTNGDVGAQFSLALPGGGAQALTLTGDYSANDAGAFTAMAAELDGLLTAQGIDVTSTGAGNLTFTYATTGATANDMAFTAVDGQATTALTGSAAFFVDGAPASPTGNATFTVSDGTASTVVALSGNYSDDTDAATGVGGNSMVADIAAALLADGGKFTVAKGTGAWDLVFTSTANTDPVTVTADAGTQVGANAILNGFTAGTGTEGAPASTSNAATFEVDGNTVTLDADYASLTDLATGNVGSLQAKLNAVAPGDYQVSVDGSNIVISKADIADLAAPVIANGTADADTVAAGIMTNTPTAGNLASTDSSISFKVDGIDVTLTGNYTGDLDAMMADIATALGDGYEVVEDPENAGSILITNLTGGSAAVTVSDADANAQAAGFSATPVSGTAGTVAGSVTLASGEFTIKVGDGDTKDFAGTYASAADLVTAINREMSGISASLVDGKLQLMSTEQITLGGTEATGTMGFSATTFAADSGSLSATNVLNVSAANETIVRIDAALTSVSTLRSTFGSIQNRFESTISNLTTTAENLTAARSRIQDADFAQETANLTRAQILQQAGVAMLAQANALPNQVLTLLRG